jgi:hypothetical protein
VVNICKGLLNGLASFADIFKILLGLITRLLWFLKGLCQAFHRRFHRPPRSGCCLHLPPTAYKRPDPLIYDQYYLMAQGLSVTWDNPDINLQDMSGNPVSGDDLNPDTDYQVFVTVYNNSYEAPAVGLPIYLSFLSFGIGTTSTPIGVTTVNLSVKGGSNCPATTPQPFIWHTPTTPGHYCLQALLVWSDDANPNNNLGQKNTHVAKLQSPAVSSIEVRNRTGVERHFELEADMYQLPTLPSCSNEPPPPRMAGRYAESKTRWEAALRKQAYGRFPVTSDWILTISPKSFALGPNASINVSVAIGRASGASFSGTQPFNIHGFASVAGRPRSLVGGVTLLVEGN